MHTAFIGTGWWGTELAAAAERTNGRVVVSAGCSPIDSERVRFGQKFRCPVHGSLATVLADRTIEAVVLATPHSLHADQAVAAANAGKHVFVEKPLALTTADAMSVIAECANAGVMLAVGHNRRLLPQVKVLRDALADQICGQTVHVEANFSTPEALSFPADHWRSSRAECPGGGMTVLGIHVIDWMHALFGQVERVSASFSRRGIATGLDDSAAAILSFRSGLSASLVSLYAAPYTNTFVVHGTDATISVVAAGPESEAVRPTVTIRRRDGSHATTVMPYVDTLKLQLESWARACQTGSAPAVTGIEAARNVAVLDAMVRSAAAHGAPTAPDDAAFW